MNFIQHRACNDVLRAPPGVSIEECRPLPIARTFTPEEGHQVLSFWTPSAEELELLNKGHAVVLGVQGGTHPPLWLAVAAEK